MRIIAQLNSQHIARAAAVLRHHPDWPTRGKLIPLAIKIRDRDTDLGTEGGTLECWVAWFDEILEEVA